MIGDKMMSLALLPKCKQILRNVSEPSHSGVRPTTVKPRLVEFQVLNILLFLIYLRDIDYI